MQFYKLRDFGTLVSDTFNFFKIYGKNYAKNYFLLNGIPLILLVLIFVVGYREFFSHLLGMQNNGDSYYFERFFAENIGLLIFAVVLMFILGITVSVINYSFPVFYLNRVSNLTHSEVKTDDLLSDLRKNINKLFILILGLMFLLTPIFLVIFGLSIVLIFVVIGIFLLFMLIPAFVNVVNFLFYDYLLTNKKFMDAFSFSFRAQFAYPRGSYPSPFWKYWGTTAAIYLIMYVISMIFTMIPYFIFFGALYSIPTGGGNFEQNPMEGTMGIVFFLIYGISILFSFIMMNFLTVACGLMYFDNRVDLHQKVHIEEIDTIGKNEV